MALPKERSGLSGVEVLAFRNLIPEVADALDVQEVLTEIVSEATDPLKAESGDIILKDPELGVLRAGAVAGFLPEIVGSNKARGKGSPRG